MASDAVLLALAESIADGRDIDWNAAELQASPEARAVLRQLRVVSNLAVLHRSLPPALPGPSLRRTFQRKGIPSPAIGEWRHLTLIERLGAGSSGEVFRAWDRDLEREVALKLLRIEDPSGDLLTSRIAAEARLLARIRHQNVVTVHGVASHEGRVGLWMDLVRGSTLEQLISERGPFGPREAAHIGIELCRALAAVHAAGLVHRDVKAQNVMREEGGRIVLMDLGTGRDMDTTATGSTDVAGTPLYIAPEVFTGTGASARTDLYSLGVLLYRLVTGAFPVRAATIEELRAKHAAREATPLRDVRPDLPATFVQVIERATAADPSRRYATAGALEADLARSLEEPAPATVVSREPRSWWYAGSFAAAAAIMLAAFVWYSRGTGRAPVTPGGVVRSIAVLPLANLSADPSQEYFADGMTEELIATLGQIPGLNVISRTSAMRFKGSKVPLPEIARALRVDAVLEGAVFAASGSSAGAAPTNVRITARLIEAGSDTQLWNRTFEAGLSDVLQLQRQIAGAVSEAVNVQRGAQSAAPAATRTDAATQDPIVFDLYLRGRYYWNTRTEEGLKRSIQYFQEAIDRDPKFARAYVGLADAYTFLAVYGRADREDAASRANAAAATALAMDDSLAEAHASLALIAEQRFDWDEAQRRFSRAIALKPGYAAAHHWYADYLSKRGQIRDAIAEIQTALSLDPLSTSVNAELGALQIFARDYDAAIAQLEKTSRMDPGFAKTHLALAEVYGYKRDFTRAFSEAAKAEVKPGDAVSQGTYAFVLAAAGRRAEAIRIREDLASRYAARDEDAATGAAIISVALGEHDQAFTWLERARERKEPWIAYFAVDPRFDAIRPDARSAKLLAALGLAR